MTIDILPDDALLEIFSFFREDSYFRKASWWIPLAHTCQRWRCIIFALPVHLNAVLVCNRGTSVRKSTKLWPRFPISIHYSFSNWEDEINISAALEHRDDVSEISLYQIPIAHGRLATMLQEPFPALTYFHLSTSNWPSRPALPEIFFGGSASSLRKVFLESVPFPAFLRLVLSAPNLVSLALHKTPVSGYIPSEAMATCLATLINLERLDIRFPSTSPHPDHTIPPSLPRAVLPALTRLSFDGFSGYLEDFLSRIDTPVLRALSITFTDSVSHIPQLFRTISCAERFKPPEIAVLEFRGSDLTLRFAPSDSFDLYIKCDNMVERSLAMRLICDELSPLLCCINRLILSGERRDLWLIWCNNMEPMQWLDFLRPFIAATSLHVSYALWGCFKHALSGLTEEEATGMLPELRTLFVEASRPFVSVPKGIEQFVAARQLSGRPIEIQPWIP